MCCYPKVIERKFNSTQMFPLDDSMFNNRELFLGDYVDSVTVDTLIFQFKYLNEIDPEAPIYFYIDSPGGEVTAGLCLFDVITGISAPVITIDIGRCSSMGSILFLAGEKRSMLRHSSILIHDPVVDMGEVQPRTAMEKLIALDSVKNVLTGIISDRTGLDLDVVKELTEKETIFNYDKAVEYGFVNADCDFMFKGGR
jgi:Protease subunit of ATP-dependent Clp proteases